MAHLGVRTHSGRETFFPETGPHGPNLGCRPSSHVYAVVAAKGCLHAFGISSRGPRNPAPLRSRLRISDVPGRPMRRRVFADSRRAATCGSGHCDHPPQTQHPSAAREGQPERGHLLAVANEQEVACQHRVVPGLAFDRRESGGELRELIGCRPDQRQLTFFRQHQ
jgi:hypothetical protein